MNNLWYAKKLTLFYKTHIPRVLSEDAGSMHNCERVADDDLIGFRPLSNQENSICAEAMRHVVENTNHAIEVHLHHEGFTMNNRHRDKAREIFERNKQVAAYDGERFSLALRRSIRQIELECGIKIENWFFVHGNWALNGCDPGICQLSNEIELLSRNGCLGDFTFPAPGSINPLIKRPFFIKGIDMLRSYDSPLAEPEDASGRADLAGNKFFIWSSALTHELSSVDMYGMNALHKIADTGSWIKSVISNCEVMNGDAFFKTHAHSIHLEYIRVRRHPIFPLEHPTVQDFFGVLGEACDVAGAKFVCLTAREAFELICSGES